MEKSDEEVNSHRNPAENLKQPTYTPAENLKQRVPKRNEEYEKLSEIHCDRGKKLEELCQ